MRAVSAAGLALAAGTLFAGHAAAQPFVSAGDIVTGWSQFSSTPTTHFDRTIELYSAAGVLKPDSWNQFLGIQSVEVDNEGGIPHNPMGNLVGVDFGATGVGFRIYGYDSGNAWTGNAMFNDTGGLMPNFGSYGLTISRGGGLSISPDNTKLALTGSDSGQIYIFNYDASTRTITGGQQTNDLPPPLATSDTGGTAWLDNTTVAAISATGQLYTVDVTQNPITAMARLQLPGTAQTASSDFSSLAYRAHVSPYLYAGFGSFDSATSVTTNNIWVIDPRTNPWTLVAGPIGFTNAPVNTMREIALGDDGALYWTTHGNSTVGFSRIHKVAGVTNPASIQPNSSVIIAQTTFSSSFNGLDVAGGVAPPACYANCDGSTVTPVLNVQDFTCFLQRYAAGESYANCDGSTIAPVLNVQDFTCFLQRYAAGCP